MSYDEMMCSQRTSVFPARGVQLGSKCENSGIGDTGLRQFVRNSMELLN